MDWIMIPLNFAIVFGGIYKVIELFVHKRERLMLISKITELKNIDFKGISLYSSGNKYTALRIGWLLLGVGCGFLLGFCINMMATYGDYSFRADENSMVLYSDRVSGIVYVASVCICGGIGLLMSYHAERKAEQPKEKKDEFEV
ncbi:MAG: hypothetical protein IJ537_06260 [Bacteroidaceae bacterium]|nr:hypothetical protein [Bacteroidaceae bacterium]